MNQSARKLVVAVLLAFLAATAHAQTTQPVFIVAVFQQPADSFAKWHALGFNAIINPVFGVGQAAKTAADAEAAAKSAGLFAIGADPAFDAFNQPDEADGNGIDPETCQKQYAAWKKANPSKLVFLNLDGRRRQFTPLATYQQYATACDVMLMDRYPVATGTPGDIPLIGGDIDLMRQAAPGKKIGFIFEASNQHLELSAWLKATDQAALCAPPTVAQLTQEVGLRKLDCAGFFTHDVCGNAGGWASFDSVTPEIRAALPGIIASLLPPVTGPLEGTPVIVGGHQYFLRSK